MICWLNGVLGDIEQARIDPRDRGFLLGDGIFETLLAEAGGVRRVRRHLARLRGAAALLDIALRYPDDEIIAAMQSLLSGNRLLQDRAVVRLTLTRGPGGRGIQPALQTSPTLVITADAAPPPPVGVRAVLSTILRNERSIICGIKSLNYLDNILARREAAARGAGEALLRNHGGGIAGASAANIFIVRDSTLLTPPLSEGALPGIMRGCVMQAANRLQLPLRETRIDLADLQAAQEAFVSNALIGVCPLLEFEGRAIAPGPMTRALRDEAALLD